MKKTAVLFLLIPSAFLSADPLAAYGACKEATEQATRLKIIETQIQVKGRTAPVYEILVDGESKTLQKTEGECFNVIVENQTSVPTTLHWHGLILPILQDGVAYLTQAPIPPGKSYPYNFKVVQSGTYFAHSHFGLQEQKLMGVPMILQPQQENASKDVVLYFEDFTFKTIEEVWQGLRKKYVAMAKQKGSGWLPSLDTNMNPGKQDLNDVDYDAYLMNRRTLENPNIFSVKAGDEVRLRLINGSTSTNFHISLGKLQGKVIAVDGSPVVPVEGSQFPLATAQRIDVLITVPLEDGAFPILAQGQGTNMRTGAILKTEGAVVSPISMTAEKTLGAITNDFEMQLQALHPLLPRTVNRELTVELEGNMGAYVWAINNFVWPNNQPLFVEEGDRVEMSFVNKTGMSHPMHLHGHVFQVVEIDGKRFSGAVRDTVLVMPNQTVKVQFDAINPGIWALHCHIAYHSWAGMFTVLEYKEYKPPFFPQSAIREYSRIYGGY